MNYLSICSGIEAATAAWHPLGWSPLAFSEIEPFPSAVLAHHHPDVPNLGDMTKYEEWKFCRCLSDIPHEHERETGRGKQQVEPSIYREGRSHVLPRYDGSQRRRDPNKNKNCETCGHPIIDLLVGGTPCQAFSVAGLRKGLADPRGNLTLTFLAMVDRFRPSWVVWENVPGVLSDKSNAFGMFLAGLGELGYEYAYRVLDAQHFGVPQRRRRVFVVASIGGVHPGKVLFEPESLCRDLTPSRGEGEVAPTIPSRSTGGGGLGTDFDCDGGLIPNVANPLTARMHKGINTTCDEGQTPIVMRADNGWRRVSFAGECFGGDGDECGDICSVCGLDYSGECQCPGPKQDGIEYMEIDGVLYGRAQAPIAFTQNQRDEVRYMDVAGALAVRRLTPVECERLQGFPDDHTRIPWRGKPADQCPDGPRYKALGNSMAVPVMAWIGERIAKFSGA